MKTFGAERERVAVQTIRFYCHNTNDFKSWVTSPIYSGIYVSGGRVYTEEIYMNLHQASMDPHA